ncbi:MAG: DUF4293 domain-containing protein [Sphingobacteriaceae bacterium]
MIQRLQSIYLLLASLALFALFLFPIAHDVIIDNIPKTIKLTGMYEIINGQEVQTTSFIILNIAAVIIALLPLVVIFFYKKRKRQLSMCYGTVLAIIGMSFWVAQTIKNVVAGASITANNYSIGALLPSIAIIMMIFAIKGIRNDEKLIRSADRLR